MKKNDRSLQEQIVEVEARGSAALADANAAAERGARKTAEKLYERSQRLLDKANELRGWN